MDRVVGVGQSAVDSVQHAYHVMADKATEVGINAQQQLAHAAEGEGMGARVAGTALGGFQATSNVAYQGLHFADQQVCSCLSRTLCHLPSSFDMAYQALHAVDQQAC